MFGSTSNDGSMVVGCRYRAQLTGIGTIKTISPSHVGDGCKKFYYLNYQINLNN